LLVEELVRSLQLECRVGGLHLRAVSIRLKANDRRLRLLDLRIQK
jgi:hypothetical protein